jgi:hypothetical protein
MPKVEKHASFMECNNKKRWLQGVSLSCKHRILSYVKRADSSRMSHPLPLKGFGQCHETFFPGYGKQGQLSRGERLILFAKQIIGRLKT